VYFIHSLADSVGALNLDTLEYCDTAVITERIPNQLVCTDSHLFVLNSGSNSLQQFGLTFLNWEQTIDLGVGTNPYGMIHLDNRLLTSHFLTHELAVIDYQAGVITERIDIRSQPYGDRDNPHPQTISQGASFLGVCNPYYNFQEQIYETGEVLILNRSDLSFVARIRTKTNPQNLWFNDEKQELHVICTGINGGEHGDDGVVQIFSYSDWVMQDELFLGGSPGSYAVDKESQRVYIAGVGAVMAYDVDTKEIIYSFTNPLIAGEDRENHFFSGITLDTMNRTLILTDFTFDRIILRQLANPALPWQEINVGDGPLAPIYFHVN